MPLYRPSELLAFLASEGLIALKSLSQNFLVDGNVIAKIGGFLNIARGEAVLEIGPGPGVVTEYLCCKTPDVLTVEKDAAFARAIRRFQGVTSIHADALKIDLAESAALHFPHQLPLKVVSNLPYASASAFLSALLPNHSAFRSLTLMLPREIAEKMRGEGHAHWLFAAKRVFCRSEKWQSVSRHCFFPKPQTESVLAHFELQSELTPFEGRIFLQWLRKICSLKKRKGEPGAVYHTPEQRSRISSKEWVDLWKGSEGHLIAPGPD